MVASGEKGEAHSLVFECCVQAPRSGAPWMCAPLRRREPRTYAMVAHSARDGGARPPQLARGPSRGADGAPDDVRLWPLPRASQTDEEAVATADERCERRIEYQQVSAVTK